METILWMTRVWCDRVRSCIAPWNTAAGTSGCASFRVDAETLILLQLMNAKFHRSNSKERWQIMQQMALVLIYLLKVCCDSINITSIVLTNRSYISIDHE